MKKFFSKEFFLVCLIVFVIIAFFVPFLIKGKIPIPADDLIGLYHPWRDLAVDGYSPGKFPAKNPLITDPILQSLPWKHSVINNLKEGTAPLWNPNSFAGQPLLANVQSSTFNVFNILFFFLPFKLAWSALIITSLILLGIFMFFFLKSLELSSLAAFFGAMTLPFTGFFVSWLEWGTVLYSAIWLPLILLAMNKIKEKPNSVWFLTIVFAVSQSVFAGHWQTAMYVLSTVFLYLIFVLLKTKNRKNLLYVAAALILGIFVSSPQIFPSFEFLKQSARDLDQAFYPGRKDWFFPLSQLVQIIAPDFFGNPTKGNYWGIWNYGEFAVYLGIPSLVLVFISFLKKLKHSYFFIFLSIFACLLAVENPISRFIYANFPYINSLQPSRIIVLLIFSQATLASIGMNFLITKKLNKIDVIKINLFLFVLLLFLGTSLFFTSKIVQIESVSSITVALRNSILPLSLIAAMFFLLNYFALFRKEKIILILFLLISLADLFRFSYRFNSFSKPSWVFPETKITEYLSHQQKPFRITSTSRQIFPPNSTAYYDIETVAGYDPLFLKDYAKFVSSWNSGKPSEATNFNRIITPENITSPITDFLNVQFVATFDSLDVNKFDLVLTEGQTKLYKNKQALPRAFFVDRLIKTANPSEELNVIMRPDFNFTQEAVSSEIGLNSEDNVSKATITNYNSQSLSLKATTEKPAPLIISNIYYPGWKAYIDGEPNDLIKVNYTFQGLIIPTGTHTVKLIFQSTSFKLGIYLASFSLVLSFIISIYLWKKRFQ